MIIQDRPSLRTSGRSFPVGKTLRLIAIISCALALFSPVRGQDSSRDVKSFLNELIGIQNRYIGSIKKARSGGEVVTAINGFGSSLVSLYQRAKDLDKITKGPKTDSDLPGEVVQLIDASDKLNIEVSRLTETAMYRYSDDEAVTRAINEMRSRLAQCEK